MRALVVVALVLFAIAVFLWMPPLPDSVVVALVFGGALVALILATARRKRT